MLTLPMFPSLEAPDTPQPASCGRHYWLRVGAVLIEGRRGDAVVHVSGPVPVAASDQVALAVRSVAACVEFGE